MIRESDRYARTLRDCERACNNARFSCLGFAYGTGRGYSGGSEQRELVDRDPRYIANNR